MLYNMRSETLSLRDKRHRQHTFLSSVICRDGAWRAVRCTQDARGRAGTLWSLWSWNTHNGEYLPPIPVIVELVLLPRFAHYIIVADVSKMGAAPPGDRKCNTYGIREYGSPTAGTDTDQWTCLNHSYGTPEPWTNSRDITPEFGLSQPRVLDVLKEAHLHPYF
jgi:hypothetical protein